MWTLAPVHCATHATMFGNRRFLASFGAALAKHSVVGTSVTENPEPTYAHKAQFSIKTLLLVTAIVALPVAGIMCITQRRSAWQAEVKRRADQDVFTVKQIVIEVDAAYQTLGRAPKDQAELESVIGKSMPNVHDNGYPTPIHYMRTSETSYLLQYELWATDDWIYDSTKPQAGWVQHFY